MKTFDIVKNALLLVAITALLLDNASYAEVDSSADLIKVQPSSAYHAIRGKSLSETLDAVARLSGITFKIGIDLSEDVVAQSLITNDWKIMVRSLLVNFNFVIIQESNVIKSVIISSRNKDIHDAGTIIAAADDVNYFEHRLSIMQIERAQLDDESPQ